MKRFIFSSLLLSGAALAADGDPDLQYGLNANGTAKIDTSPLGSMLNYETLAATPGPSGSVYVASSLDMYPGNSVQIAIARLNYGGKLDPGFGSGGLVRTQFAEGSIMNVQDAFATADGGVVVAILADFVNSYPQMMLCKYAITGQLDATFGGFSPVAGCQIVVDSVLLTGYPSGARGRLIALTPLPDGRFIGAWTHGADTTNTVIKLARFTAQGTIADDGFGALNDYGIATLNWPAQVHDLAIDSTGRIVIAASMQQQDTDTDGVILRFAADGSFMGSASFVVDAGTSKRDVINSVAVLPNDDIVAAGYVDKGTNTPNYYGAFTHLAAANLSEISNGFTAPDGTFQLCAGACSGQPATDIAVQPDGKVLVAGTFQLQGDSDPYAQRLNAVGFDSDHSFGVVGTSYIDPDTAGDTTGNKKFDTVARVLMIKGRPFVVGQHGRANGQDVITYPSVTRLQSDVIFQDGVDLF